MNELYQFISGYTEPMTAKVVLLSLFLACALSQVIAATYIWTFRGMSYSRSFVLTLGVGGIISCMVMLAINNSIAAGLGIAGSLAFVRFRSALRDPRDMVFVFASLATGIAAGLRIHLAAVLGAGIFCAAVFLFTKAEFGTQRRFDGLLRFQLPVDVDEAQLSPILRRHTRSFALVSLREAGQGHKLERAYQVQLADRDREVELLAALESLPGIQALSLLLQEPTVEL
jgi:hypothetical protein